MHALVTEIKLIANRSFARQPSSLGKMKRLLTDLLDQRNVENSPNKRHLR